MEVVDNKCPNCGSNLDYDPKNKKFKCSYCNNEYSSNDIKKRKIIFDILICPNCNATVFTNDNVISIKCVYCGNNVIVSKTNDKYQMPEKIIPFSFNKEQAILKLETFLNEKKLLPDNFNSKKNIKNIKGIYIPFWLYNISYKVRLEDTMPVKKEVIDFNLIPIDANKHLDNRITSGLEPFNYSELIDFDTSYLSGFLAQKYDMEAEEMFNEVDERCKESINNLFTNKISRMSVENIGKIKKKFVSCKYSYALLPIWLINIKYNDINYYVAMNGQTGKIVAQLPIDKSKYKRIRLFIFIIISVLVTIIALLLRLGNLI